MYVPEFDLEFNHFVVDDEEPLLYHTGMRRHFPEIRDAVARVIDPARLRWISYSHFEVDECGALNDWFALAPNAQAAVSVVGALVNLGDFAARPARGLEKGKVLATGKYRFRFHPTPHLPHGWDAGVLFEETQGTLFCSDLFHQSGPREPVTSDDVLERSRATLVEAQQGPLMDYVPYSTQTRRLLYELAEFEPRTLAIMHGSSFTGDGGRALRELDTVFKEVLGNGHD